MAINQFDRFNAVVNYTDDTNLKDYAPQNGEYVVITASHKKGNGYYDGWIFDIDGYMCTIWESDVTITQKIK